MGQVSCTWVWVFFFIFCSLSSLLPSHKQPPAYDTRLSTLCGQAGCGNGSQALLAGSGPWAPQSLGSTQAADSRLVSLSGQIEEGGKADLVSSKLQAGDEVVHINEVVLSSSRREAVSLVKGSYKTLRLVVRR